MFIILLTYKKPLEIVDQYLAEHRNFLAQGYEQNYLAASGPQLPRTGGVIISQLKDRATLETFINNDPFKIHDVAEYTFIEFEPVKYHENFKYFVT